MQQIQSRLGALERHRHPANVNVDAPEVEPTKWFRASVASGGIISIGVDGNSKVPLSAKTDPYGMLDAQYRFVPPSSGPVQVSAGVQVQTVTTDASARVNVHGVIVDLDAGDLWMIRGSQYVNNTVGWLNSGGQESVLSGIIEVTVGHRYEFQAYAYAPNVTKQFATNQETTYFTGFLLA